MIVESLPQLERLMEEDGAPYIVDDPTGEAIAAARPGSNARKVSSRAVDSDAINVYITLTARTLNPKLFIVARASSPEVRRSAVPRRRRSRGLALRA